MDDAPLSRRQFAALLWAVMVSPMIRQAPGGMMARSGGAAWLTAMLCAVPAAGLGLFLGRFLRTRRPGEGLGELLCRAAGPGPGRVLCGIWGLWLLYYSGFVLRAGADRFVSAAYTGSPEWLFMAVMLALVLPAGLGRVKTLGRCAQITAPLLAAVFALVFVFSVKNIDPAGLALWPGDTARAAAGMPPLLAALAVTAHLGFLAGHVEPGDLGKPAALVLSALAALAALLSASVVGTFGAALAGRMNYPFFVMIRSLRLFNLIERVEALVAAQWVAADYLLLSALLHAAASALTISLRGPGRRPGPAAVWLCAGLVALAGAACASTAFSLRAVGSVVVPAGSALLVYGALPVCFFIGRAKGRI